MSAPKLSATLTVDDVKEASAKALPGNMKVYTQEDAPEKGAAIKWASGQRQGEAVVYVSAVLRHDQRVKLTFGRTNNAHGDAILNMQGDFNKEAAFAAALRITLGDSDVRFRSRTRVETLVKKVGVSEIAKAMPTLFSDFMFAVLHVYNCKLGKDVGEQVKALRQQIHTLVPHLTETDVVRIYREELVDWVNKS